MIAVWLLLLLASIVGASLASQRAVTAALGITETLGVSPALVGVTVLAVGTDLPEIANSLVSAGSGHGDVNVGDSMGSVFTQVTLVLGILWVATGGIKTDRSFVARVGAAVFVASLTVWLLVSDGDLSHLDGLLLVSGWAAGSALIGRGEDKPNTPAPGERGHVASAVMRALLWLGIVGVFAVGVVQSFLAASEILGIPEFVGSFIVLSIGTSLPELVVDWTAIRRGASSMAIGDIFGSSFVDATLSVGIGPLVFGSQLSSGVARGVAVAAVGALLATIIVVTARRRTYGPGVRLLVVYVAAQIAVVVL